MYDEKNTECLLYGTDECRLLNPEGCLECRVGRMKPEQQAELREALARLRAEAPEDMVVSLAESETCRLCRGEPKKAEQWALFDLAKGTEKPGWTILQNLSATKKAGVDVLPLQVACCRGCRKRIRRAEFLPTLVGVIIAGLGLFLSTFKPVYTQAYNVKPWLPVVIFLGFTLAGVIAAIALRSSLAASAAKHTHTDVSEIPEVAALIENGWQVVEKKHGKLSAMVFSKKMREHGIYTRTRSSANEEMKNEE